MNENPNPAGGPAPDDTQHQINLAAAEWMVRRDRGFTAAEQDEFFSWLATDPRHGEAFAQQQATWHDLDQLAQWRPEHATEPNPDLLARPLSAKKKSLPPLIYFPVLLAAAAAVALLLTWERPWSRLPAASETKLAAAPAGERRVLEDGSTVDLAHGAAIEVRFSADDRHVRLLRGEAFFTVAKNPARPFIVNAGGINVRAVGTAFNVRLDAKSVAVQVTEGRVAVRGQATGNSGQGSGASPSPVSSPLSPETSPDTFLDAGQSAVVPLPPPVMVVPPPPVAVQSAAPRAPARLLDFQSVPLADVVGAFNREGRVQLTIADAELERVPVTVSFRADNVEAFVRLLEATAGVTADRTGGAITLRKAP